VRAKTEVRGSEEATERRISRARGARDAFLEEEKDQKSSAPEEEEEGEVSSWFRVCSRRVIGRTGLTRAVLRRTRSSQQSCSDPSADLMRKVGKGGGA
jgi:hypothetical protein